MTRIYSMIRTRWVAFLTYTKKTRKPFTCIISKLMTKNETEVNKIVYVYALMNKLSQDLNTNKSSEQIKKELLEICNTHIVHNCPKCKKVEENTKTNLSDTFQVKKCIRCDDDIHWDCEEC